MEKKKVVLVMINGWGIQNDETIKDAIRETKPRYMTELAKKYPSFELKTMGEYIGLRRAHISNSPIAHRNVGTGRTDISNKTLLDRTVFTQKMNEVFVKFNSIEHDRCHIIGLASDNSIYGRFDYLLEVINEVKAKNIFMHVILDGIECNDKKGYYFLKELVKKEKIEKRYKVWKIASVIGRNYILGDDIDEEKLDITYNVITSGKFVDKSPRIHVRQIYNGNLRDADIYPILFIQDGMILPGDTIVFANEKIDNWIKFIRRFHTMNRCYSFFDCREEGINLEPLFPKIKVENTLPHVIAENDMRHGYISDTTTYDDITYHFRGGLKKSLKDEVTICVGRKCDMEFTPSITDLVSQILNLMMHGYHFISCTLSALDIVVKTGTFKEICEIVAEIDYGIGTILELCLEYNYTLVIVGLYGNVESFYDLKTREENRSITKNHTPFIFCSGENLFSGYKCGADFSLRDVAPTILGYMGINIPNEMTGHDLLKNYKN